jgi:hypothetical protein
MGTVPWAGLDERPATRSGMPMGRETSRRDSIEAVGLLLGILGILIVVAAMLADVPIGWA